jgi:zinc protease
MSARFELPQPGPATAVRFPDIARDELPNGLRVLSVVHSGVPVVAAALILESGSAADPPDRPGLAGLVADLSDEGAGGRDAIALADAFARMGSRAEMDIGPDVTAVSVTTLSRFLSPVLALVADIVARPHLLEPDLARVRDLRLMRLRQLGGSPSAIADRAYLDAVFPTHPYGHGSLGTSRSLTAITLEEARAFWAARFGPARSTLVVAGDAAATDVMAAAREAFAGWSAVPADGPRLAPGPVGEGHRSRQVLVVDRGAAPQSEVRIGHVGPPRRVEGYHTLVTLNAVLGGQFTSRINRNLRETRGITYGARTAFDMRRLTGTFGCDTSVQGDATAVAVQEILKEMSGIQSPAGAVGSDELEAAKASLTRGYARHFETAAHLARAMAQLVTYELDRDAFDRFVPEVEAVTADDVTRAAGRFVHPDQAAVVVVGDRQHVAPLEDAGFEMLHVAPEF